MASGFIVYGRYVLIILPADQGGSESCDPAQGKQPEKL